MAIGVEFHGDWISFFAGSHLGVFFYPDRLTEKYQMHAQIKTIYIGIDCAIYIEHTMTNSQICNLNAEICLIYLNLSELTIKFRIFGDFQTTFWPITIRLPLWKGVIGLIRGSGKNCRKKHFFLKLMLYQWLRYNTELFSLKIFFAAGNVNRKQNNNFEGKWSKLFKEVRKTQHNAWRKGQNKTAITSMTLLSVY